MVLFESIRERNVIYHMLYRSIEMHDTLKIYIYDDIISYLVEITNYPLKKIANLASIPVEHLETIWVDHCLPPDRHSEIKLLNLFTTMVDMEIKGLWRVHLNPSEQ